MASSIFYGEGRKIGERQIFKIVNFERFDWFLNANATITPKLSEMSTVTSVLRTAIIRNTICTREGFVD